MKMKKLLPLLFLCSMALVACDPAATTTTPTGDSTATVKADSNPVMPETSPVANVTPTPVDSPVVSADPVDNTGKKADPSRPDPIVSNYRLTVSFISIGSGIDSKAKEKYDNFVLDFGKKNKVKLPHETVTWGREGEVDYCFKLAELDQNKQAEFVKESMALLTGNKRVQFKEKTTCRAKRN
jgi:hypothetical protein